MCVCECVVVVCTLEYVWHVCCEFVEGPGVEEDKEHSQGYGG